MCDIFSPKKGLEILNSLHKETSFEEIENL